MSVTDVVVAVDHRGWFTSSYSNAGGSCVEVKFDGGVVLVRDSKNCQGERLVIGVPGAQWTAFVERVREW